MPAPKRTLEDWLDDLCVRFIINLPQEDLSSVARICFQVEEAQWFYEDFIRPTDPALPSMTLKAFCMRIFAHCPLLAPFSAENHMRAFEEFMQYKARIPVRGAIMLNDEMDSTVLVKGWKKGANWSFPRGKINKDEPDLDCAVREVYEETGLDLRAAGLIPHDENVKYIEVTMKGQQLRLYVFRDVPMDTHFQPRTRKEISKIQWYKLSELPTFKKKDKTGNQANHHRAASETEGHTNNNKFYMVAPFLAPLKKWVAQQKRLDENVRHTYNNSLTAPYLAQEEVVTEEETGAQTESAFEPEPVPTTAIDTLEGATRELHRLLKIQPPTQGQARPSVSETASRRDAGEALMAMLKPQADVPQSESSYGVQPMLHHNHSQQQQQYLSIAAEEAADYGGDYNSQPDAAHRVQQHIVVNQQQLDQNSRQVQSLSGKAHWQQQPQSNAPHVNQFDGGGQSQIRQYQAQHVAQHMPAAQNQPLMFSRHHFGNEPIPLMHPQPLPPQVQKALLNRGMLPSPGIPEASSGANSHAQKAMTKVKDDKLAGLLAALYAGERAAPAGQDSGQGLATMPAKQAHQLTNLLASSENSNVPPVQGASSASKHGIPQQNEPQNPLLLLNSANRAAGASVDAQTLSAHSMSLLDAFKSDKAQGGASQSNMTAVQQQQQNQYSTQYYSQYSSQPALVAASAQQRSVNLPSAQVAPPAASQPGPTDKHRSALLQMFKTEGSATGEASAPAPAPAPTAATQDEPRLRKPSKEQFEQPQQQQPSPPVSGGRRQKQQQQQSTVAEALRAAAQANGGQPIQMNPDLNLPYRAVALLQRPKQPQQQQQHSPPLNQSQPPSSAELPSHQLLQHRQRGSGASSKASSASGLTRDAQHHQPLSSSGLKPQAPLTAVYGTPASGDGSGRGSSVVAASEPFVTGLRRQDSSGASGSPTGNVQKQKLLALFGSPINSAPTAVAPPQAPVTPAAAQPSVGKGLLSLLSGVPQPAQDKGKAKDLPSAYQSLPLGTGAGQTTTDFAAPSTIPRSRLASLASTAGDGGLAGTTTPGGGVPMARGHSQSQAQALQAQSQITPISPADRNFLFEYLGSVTK